MLQAPEGSACASLELQCARGSVCSHDIVARARLTQRLARNMARAPQDASWAVFKARVGGGEDEEGDGVGEVNQGFLMIVTILRFFFFCSMHECVRVRARVCACARACVRAVARVCSRARARV